MDFILLVSISYAIYLVYKRYNSQHEKSDLDDNNIEYSFSIRKPSGKPAKWLKPGEATMIQDHNISSGMIYVGELLLDTSEYDNDHCLIDPKLKVIKSNSWEHSSDMGYWPSYEDIPARCRGAYLNWLESGRNHPDAGIGYVFLFFYGLERRLFFESISSEITDEERISIINEVRRLLSIYGDSSSFKRYANSFLATEWILNRNEEPVPKYINFSDCYNYEPFKFRLAQFVQDEKPLPWDVALEWILLHPEYRVRTPARRCKKEFRILFSKKYRDKFGEGLVVKRNKKKLKLSYQAANSSLRALEFKDLGLVDAFDLKTPLRRLDSLVQQCTDLLAPYSRYLGRKGKSIFEALALIPREILLNSKQAKKLKSTLDDFCSNGIKLIPIKSVLKAIDGFERDKIYKKDFQYLTTLSENLGYGVVPDFRYQHVAIKDSDEIIFFKEGYGQNFQPSKDYEMTLSIIRLGSLVAQISNGVSPKEEVALQSIVRENERLNTIEKTSLYLFLYWSLRTPQSLTGLNKRLSGASAREKKAISHILISVALAEGHIDQNEIQQLEKTYKTLGLDEKNVIQDIHTLTTQDEPVLVAKQEKKTGYKIPKSDEQIEPSGFNLNLDLIKIRQEETRHVQSILENVFDDEEIEYPSENEITQEKPVNGSSSLKQLESHYQDLFNQLITKEQWQKEEVRVICQKMNIMTDGALEVLNEWAFENTSAPLIEDGETLFVDLELAEEIINDGAN